MKRGAGKRRLPNKYEDQSLDHQNACKSHSDMAVTRGHSQVTRSHTGGKGKQSPQHAG